MQLSKAFTMSVVTHASIMRCFSRPKSGMSHVTHLALSLVVTGGVMSTRISGTRDVALVVFQVSIHSLTTDMDKRKRAGVQNVM